MRRTQFLLLLDGMQLASYQWQSSRIHLLNSYPLSPEGEEAFRRDLEHMPPWESATLLVNRGEEDFQQFAIPYLKGRDRQAVLARKGEHYFLDTPYVLEQSLGQEKNQRKEERILLAGLTQARWLDPWLRLLESYQIPLEGIYSLAQLAAPLCRRLKLAGNNCLVLSMHQSGLRETLVKKGKVTFSRLTPLAAMDLPSLLAETQTLHQYLVRQQLLEATAPLSVYPLMHLDYSRDAPDLGQSSPLPEQLNLQVLELTECERQLGLSPQTPTLFPPFADNLFLHLLASRRPSRQFAPPALRQGHLLQQTRRRLTSATATALLASAALSGALLAYAHELQSQSHALAGEVAQLTHQVRQWQANQPEPLPEGSQELLAELSRLQAQQRSPAPMLDHLSQALDFLPDIQLEELQWETLTSGEQLSLQGHLSSPDGHQAAISFERLIQYLKDQGLQVQVPEYPSDRSLTHPQRHTPDHGTTNLNEETPQARFRLHMVRTGQP